MDCSQCYWSKESWIIYAGCIGSIFYQIIQDHPVFNNNALPWIISKMVAHRRGTLKWTTCGCQMLTFPYFIVLICETDTDVMHKHILSLCCRCLFILQSTRQNGFPRLKKNTKNKQVFQVFTFCFASNFFSISTDTSLFRFFHHIAVVSVTVCFSLLPSGKLSDGFAQQSYFPLQRLSDSDWIFQVFLSLLLQHAQINNVTLTWGIKHVSWA